MTERRDLRLGELLDADGPCGFLDAGELDAWREGRLPENTRQRFEEHAESCARCASLAADREAFERLVERGSAVAGEQRAFASADRRLRSRLRVRGGRPWWRSPAAWAVAALLIATLGIAIWLDRERRVPLIPGEIESVAMLPPPGVRGEGSAIVWDALVPAWDAGDMHGVVSAIEASPGAADDPDLQFYRGYAYLRLQRHAAAVEALRAADAHGSVPSEHTLWFLAVALDRQGDDASACNALSRVAEIGGRRAATAQGIVETSCAP